MITITINQKCFSIFRLYITSSSPDVYSQTWELFPLSLLGIWIISICLSFTYDTLLWKRINVSSLWLVTCLATARILNMAWLTNLSTTFDWPSYFGFVCKSPVTRTACEIQQYTKVQVVHLIIFFPTSLSSPSNCLHFAAESLIVCNVFVGKLAKWDRFPSENTWMQHSMETAILKMLWHLIG